MVFTLGKGFTLRQMEKIVLERRSSYWDSSRRRCLKVNTGR